MFTQSDKKIFPYWNGRQEVYGDPMALHRRLTIALGGTPNEVLKAAKSESPLENAHARERLIDAVREAFEMVPFDKTEGAGALDEDCFQALRTLLEWTEKNASRAAASPRSRPDTPDISNGISPERGIRSATTGQPISSTVSSSSTKTG